MRSLIAVTLLMAGSLAGCSSDSGSQGGSSDGPKMTVVFELTGTGQVRKISYNDVSTKRMAFVDEPTQLPWRTEITGARSDYLTLSAIPLGDVAATCKLTVDGKEVATQTEDGGVVECRVGG